MTYQDQRKAAILVELDALLLVERRNGLDWQANADIHRERLRLKREWDVLNAPREPERDAAR